MPVRLSAFSLGDMTTAWEDSLKKIQAEQVLARIWARDHTVWKSAPDEIVNRLGWLNCFSDFQDQWGAVEDFVVGVRTEGYNHVLLLGMGGSSLAPEVFRKILGVQRGYPDLSVCDTTAPAAMAAWANRLEWGKTLFVVSTKSGGTVETLSAMKYFFRLGAGRLGSAETGRHFVAITDPGSSLEDIARIHRFRRVFSGDPSIGGRYSALSVFGLVPASLIGGDPRALLKWTVGRLADAVKLGEQLGTMLGIMAVRGRNKATYILSQPLTPFGDWLEQLIAESTGKENRGILPVVGESLGMPEVYGSDRLFVRIAFREEGDALPEVEAIKGAGHPLVELRVDGVNDLGELMYVWEMATAVACHFLGVNPFDQPDVEASKQFTREVITRMQHEPVCRAMPAVNDGDVSCYGCDSGASHIGEALSDFLRSVEAGGYIALQAYLAPSAPLDSLLAELRVLLRDRYRVATTVGYGPRFLHSTGQLHKGDDGRGLFVQLTADESLDVGIPDEMTGDQTSLTFGVLQSAQAQGDARALESRGRRVVRVHFCGDVPQGIQKLIDFMKRPE